MKALTLHQPWASLVAAGTKCVETRSWPTRYRGPLAIHAGLACVDRDDIHMSLNDAIVRSGIIVPGVTWVEDLPRGVVLCTVDLIDCAPTEDVDALVGAQERACGDYTKGRYAWFLENLRPLDPPVPARGKQGLWEWKP